MKISLNWLKRIVKIPDEVSDSELIRLIGARLVEVEGVIDETHKYDNIYVVKVEHAEHIPDTHLTLCQINTGKTELVQVVCGAPNVREGMLAVWIAPGATVPASVHEDAPFVIGRRKMRGFDSNGMLAGADELDFGDDHSGIVEIDPNEAQPGDLLADVLELNDLVFEIENKSLTHRPDCFGMIGFAREVAGILGLPFDTTSSMVGDDYLKLSHTGRSGKKVLAGNLLDAVRNIRVKNSSQNMMLQKEQRSDVLSINISNSNICQRYTAVVLEKHGEIRKKYLTWTDTVLSKSGMKPISPIVDVTNYLMLLTGQPLHAFDYDKFVAVGGGKQATINVRLARNGEKLVLLDDKEIELNENDIVICSNDVPVALAGAMGGKSTAIAEDTGNIIIESATFSLYNLRKTQMAHGIFTEAITRFTKGQSPYQTLAVAGECVDLLASGYRVVSVEDNYAELNQRVVVKITAEEINGLLGTKYDSELIARTLLNVGFEVVRLKSGLKITVPEWRTDIHIKEDIIEEVGRLLGYDIIEPTLPLHGTAEKNSMWVLKKTLRALMAKLGANEVLTYSFVSGRLLERAGLDTANSYKIVNSISPELQYVRQSIVPCLLEKAYMNQKLPVDRFAIYEMNKVYRKEDGLGSEQVPVERVSMGFVLAERKNKDTAYYKAKKYVERVFSEFGIVPDFMPISNNYTEARSYDKNRAAEIWVKGEYVGVVGEFKNSVRNEFKLSQYLAGFEIDLDKLMKYMSGKMSVDLSEREKRDLTIATSDTYGKLVKKINEALEQNNAEAEIKPIGIYQPKEADKKNISVHLEFTKYNEGIMQILEKL